jgi:hypothetical protein
MQELECGVLVIVVPVIIITIPVTIAIPIVIPSIIVPPNAPQVAIHSIMDMAAPA